MLEVSNIEKKNPALQYNVVSNNPIGKGSYSKIYRVLRKEDRAYYALKIVSPPDEETRQNVRKEIELMRIVQSNNILKCIDAYEY